jgi:hypothetical protein
MSIVIEQLKQNADSNINEEEIIKLPKIEPLAHVKDENIDE